MEGTIVYKDTFNDLKKEGVFNKDFQVLNGSTTVKNASITYNYTMFSQAQIAGLFTAKVDRSFFRNIKGESNIISELYKVTALDLTSNEFEEIKQTNVTNGVTVDFFNLGSIPANSKRACAYYDDKTQQFFFDVNGMYGCRYQQVSEKQASCICNHNTIFGIVEYIPGTPRHTVENSSSRLTATLSIRIW